MCGCLDHCMMTYEIGKLKVARELKWCFYSSHDVTITHTTGYCDNYQYWPVCVLCTSIHKESHLLCSGLPSWQSVDTGVWVTQVHQQTFSCAWGRLTIKCTTICYGTPRVWRGAILFSTSSVNSVKEVKEYCDRDGKENVLPATVSRNAEIPERKWPRVWKICVSSLVHAWIKGHVRKL